MKLTVVRKATSLTVALFFVLNLSAQNDKLGTWDIAAMNVNFRHNWSLFLEVQTRSQKFGNDFYYHEFKAGWQYSIPKKAAFLVGMGDYKTYGYPGNFKSPATVKEFRIWEQITLVNNIGRVKIDHRYRIEQRWLNGVFANRFRYRLNPIVPINNKTIVPKTLYVSAFDELFFTNEAPYFLRNRLFGGFGYQFSKFFTLQAGLIRQYDYRKTDDGSGKNFLHLSFLFTVDKTQPKQERHPSTMD
jgi:hypothetical protein